MDKYNLHGVGGYANDPNTHIACEAHRHRWEALTPELREAALKEAESLKTYDNETPGR